MNPHEVTQWKIFATGGGSFKYETRFKDMGIRVRTYIQTCTRGVHVGIYAYKRIHVCYVQVRKSDEMETIVSGVLFAIDNIADECFTWVPPDARWRTPRAYIYVCVYM